jgi:hypothetical protein
MSDSRWKSLAAIVVTTALALWSYDRSVGIAWVGHTDLEVRFLVTDFTTGQPIPGGSIEIQSEGGFYAENDLSQFALVADEGGIASKICRESMCFGRRSGLRLTDTFAAHLPHWRFRAVAAGYEPSNPTELDVLEHRKRVHRTTATKDKATLDVPIVLRQLRD